MKEVKPIRDKEDLQNFKNYYREVCPNPRNHLMLVMGLNTALRISDLLSLQWGDVYDFSRKRFKKHLILREQKTKKNSTIYMNDNILKELTFYMEYNISKGLPIDSEIYLFCGVSKNEPITRVQAFRIIKKAAKACDIPEDIACHSLRKTFGYHAWNQGVNPVMLMNIYNHSSFETTKHYLGIEQDDRDKVFGKIML